MTDTPMDVVGKAVEDLAVHLVLRKVDGPSTHVAIVAEGLEDSEVPRALGRYLVGVVAGAVEDDATLSEQLLAVAPDSRVEVRNVVMKLVRNNNDFGTSAKIRFRDRVRNPWIAEGIGHALLLVRQRQITVCLDGDVCALKQPHFDPRRQGLDLIAIYDADGFPAVAIGEAKASANHGAARLREASVFFREIDAGRRGPEIRSEIRALKHVLPNDLLVGIVDGFWRERCCYLPLIVHSANIDEASDHSGLAGLKPPPVSRKLLALKLNAFHPFFDDVANAVRAALDEIVPDV